MKKRMKKRLLSLLLSILMVLVLVAPSAAKVVKADEASFKLVSEASGWAIDKSTIKAGDTVNIYVELQNMSDDPYGFEVPNLTVYDNGKTNTFQWRIMSGDTNFLGRKDGNGGILYAYVSFMVTSADISSGYVKRTLNISQAKRKTEDGGYEKNGNNIVYYSDSLILNIPIVTRPVYDSDNSSPMEDYWDYTNSEIENEIILPENIPPLEAGDIFTATVRIKNTGKLYLKMSRRDITYGGMSTLDNGDKFKDDWKYSDGKAFTGDLKPGDEITGTVEVVVTENDLNNGSMVRSITGYYTVYANSSSDKIVAYYSGGYLYEYEEPMCPVSIITPIEKINPTPVSVSYSTHVQSYGWTQAVSDGVMSGTYGEAKRLEGIKINVSGVDGLRIQYTTHCQSYGWLPWSANGEMSGTEGEAKRLEAIKIKLTGIQNINFDVYYRVHAQSFGWLGWAKNGEPAGTAGYAKRLEGIQIVVVKKGEELPADVDTYIKNKGTVYRDSDGVLDAYYAKAGSSPIVGYPATDNINPVLPETMETSVAVRTHVQSIGWQPWKYYGQVSGSVGQSLRLEAINIKLQNAQVSGGITYRTHVQSYGWQSWKSDGAMAGTLGEGKRLEAIEIKLTGEIEEQYDVYYRVHAQSYGWLGWAKNGEPAGTSGGGKRLEGIQIVLVSKNNEGPNLYLNGISSATKTAFVKIN